jgi:hypothetical protein
VSEALKRELAGRDSRWSEAVAVGSLRFVENVKKELGVRAMRRQTMDADGTFTLREPGETYGVCFQQRK